MANNKVGFIYYSVNTDRYSDIKLKRLKKKYKCDGIAVYDKVLCEIYREKGYYIEWNEMTCFDVAEYFELTEDRVLEIISYCCEVGLFSLEKFDQLKVLTSASIQGRFLDWSKKAKRLPVNIPEQIKIIQENSFIIQEEIGEDSGGLKQSKVKESKEKESTMPEPKFLIPEMFLKFKEILPNYPGFIKNDFEPLRKIAEFLVSQLKLNGDIVKNKDAIVSEWGLMATVVSQETFYKQKSLSVISNQIQEIYQIHKNGSATKGASGIKGRTEESNLGNSKSKGEYAKGL